MLLGFCFEHNGKNWFLLGIMVRSGGLVSIPRQLSFGEHKNLKPGAHSSNDKHAIVLKEQLGDNLLICYTSIAKLAQFLLFCDFVNILSLLLFFFFYPPVFMFTNWNLAKRLTANIT